MNAVVKPNDDGSCLIAISGAINEYAQAPFRRILLQISSATKIEVDLGRVDVINSIGTIYWSDLLKSLLKIAPVILCNCSIPVVDNLNRLPVMVAGASVSSIQVPYRCPQCRRIFSHSMRLTLLEAGSFPEVACDKCGTTAEPEVDFSDYTMFRSYSS
jgi:anti-anti-sigma regulatory factor/DNA-directed RNA polymerase subunit RPC12/RpoP